MAQKFEVDGKEVEFYSADDLAAAKTAVEGEWKPKVDELTGKLEKAISDGRSKSKSITDFKELTDAQYAKLGEAEQTIYDNQKLIADQGKIISAADQKAYDSARAGVISKVANGNKDLVEKITAMYDLVGLEDDTPEKMEIRARAARGALGETQPDLLNSLGFVGGGWAPKPKEDTSDGKKTFADTDAGKAGAAELGLKINYTDEEKKRLGIA